MTTEGAQRRHRQSRGAIRLRFAKSADEASARRCNVDYLVGGPSYLLGSFLGFLVPSDCFLGFLASLLPLFLSPMIIPKLNTY